jgi:hypothetical protein
MRQKKSKVHMFHVFLLCLFHKLKWKITATFKTFFNQLCLLEIGVYEIMGESSSVYKCFSFEWKQFHPNHDENELSRINWLLDLLAMKKIRDKENEKRIKKGLS